MGNSAELAHSPVWPCPGGRPRGPPPGRKEPVAVPALPYLVPQVAQVDPCPWLHSKGRSEKADPWQAWVRLESCRVAPAAEAAFEVAHLEISQREMTQ